jgi:hypothetical protein
MAWIKSTKGVSWVIIWDANSSTDGSRQLRLAMAVVRRTKQRCHDLLLRRGGPTATVSFSQCGFDLWGRRGTADSPKGVLGCDSDRKEPLSFDSGASSRWWHFGIISCSYGGSVTSSCSTSGQEALGDL